MSYVSKPPTKMNAYLYTFFSYFEAVLHPSSGKSGPQKEKRRQSKPSYLPQASPDCLHIRAGNRSQNGVRRNPAP